MIARAPVRTRFQRVAPWVSTLVRLVLAGVFLAAGGLKAVDPQSSVAAVRAYELLPPGLETLVGWGLPFVEIALGLVLAAGAFTRVAGAVSAALIAVFVLAVLSAAERGLSIDCGCFGGGGTVAAGQTNYAGEILRDSLLLVLALWLVWQPHSRLALEPGPVGRRELEDHR
ncbi:Methylamine utilisation protein MauE [Friedmanniella luteola]|uniref:Methylamine utilisation protein MauE n=1 Tax=Friedmanniella luteola TaxID=546871 RepID=A0A1H1USL4_9ACTN|nr:MauE/DoxX family redox-associated membrane protein [Friedmanniella luteola]SDS75280.1 Methylamine utilisation protein MauE [Friedmanniella luteola]